MVDPTPAFKTLVVDLEPAFVYLVMNSRTAVAILVVVYKPGITYLVVNPEPAVSTLMVDHKTTVMYLVIMVDPEAASESLLEIFCADLLFTRTPGRSSC